MVFNTTPSGALGASRCPVLSLLFLLEKLSKSPSSRLKVATPNWWRRCSSMTRRADFRTGILRGDRCPPLVTQIADGETGGVMMNEFPPKYIEVVRECSGSETPLVNVTEYLEQLIARGVRDADLPLVQPVFQMRIWERFKPGDGAEKLANVIEQLHKEDSRFNVEGGSWTNNISWVRGYERLLAPMEELSSLFYEKVLKSGVPTSEARYRKALFHLLVSQTSCYRYWGRGIFFTTGAKYAAAEPISWRMTSERGQPVIRYHVMHWLLGPPVGVRISARPCWH